MDLWRQPTVNQGPRPMVAATHSVDAPASGMLSVRVAGGYEGGGIETREARATRTRRGFTPPPGTASPPPRSGPPRAPPRRGAPTPAPPGRCRGSAASTASWAGGPTRRRGRRPAPSSRRAERAGGRGPRRRPDSLVERPGRQGGGGRRDACHGCYKAIRRHRKASPVPQAPTAAVQTVSEIPAWPRTSFSGRAARP